MSSRSKEIGMIGRMIMKEELAMTGYGQLLDERSRSSRPIGIPFEDFGLALFGRQDVDIGSWQNLIDGEVRQRCSYCLLLSLTCCPRRRCRPVCSHRPLY